MLRSTRAALAVGVGCMGLAGLVGHSAAQSDGRVQKVAAATPGTAPAAPAAMPQVVIGTIDVEGVFRELDKIKVAGETLNAEVQVRYAELQKIANEGKLEQEKLQRLTPGTPDFKKAEERMTQLQIQIEAGKQNAKREFDQKETETMTSIYNEVVAMAKYVANSRGMSFVVKYNEGKVQASEPNSAIAAMSRTIVYADPRVDITKATTELLNRQYKAISGKAPKAAAPAGEAPDAGAPAGRPATNPAVRGH